MGYILLVCIQTFAITQNLHIQAQCIYRVPIEKAINDTLIYKKLKNQNHHTQAERIDTQIISPLEYQFDTTVFYTGLNYKAFRYDSTFMHWQYLWTAHKHFTPSMLVFNPLHPTKRKGYIVRLDSLMNSLRTPFIRQNVWFFDAIDWNYYTIRPFYRKKEVVGLNLDVAAWTKQASRKIKRFRKNIQYIYCLNIPLYDAPFPSHFLFGAFPNLQMLECVSQLDTLPPNLLKLTQLKALKLGINQASVFLKRDWDRWQLSRENDLELFANMTASEKQYVRPTSFYFTSPQQEYELTYQGVRNRYFFIQQLAAFDLVYLEIDCRGMNIAEITQLCEVLSKMKNLNQINMLLDETIAFQVNIQTVNLPICFELLEHVAVVSITNPDNYDIILPNRDVKGQKFIP